MAELNVNIGNLQLKNPVMTASGTFGYGVEYSDFMDISRLGGIFVKGTTIQPREGNLYPRMAETPSGMLNAVGLQNKGDVNSKHPVPKENRLRRHSPENTENTACHSRTIAAFSRSQHGKKVPQPCSLSENRNRSGNQKYSQQFAAAF